MTETHFHFGPVVINHYLVTLTELWFIKLKSFKELSTTCKIWFAFLPFHRTPLQKICNIFSIGPLLTLFWGQFFHHIPSFIAIFETVLCPNAIIKASFTPSKVWSIHIFIHCNGLTHLYKAQSYLSNCCCMQPIPSFQPVFISFSSVLHHDFLSSSQLSLTYWMPQSKFYRKGSKIHITFCVPCVKLLMDGEWKWKAGAFSSFLSLSLLHSARKHM